MILAELEMPLLPPTASEFAWRYDLLFWYITAVITVAGLGVYAALAWFSWKYMKRDDGRKPIRLLGSHKLELIWTGIPLLFFLSFYAWGVVLFNETTQVPEDAPEIFVVGKQWMWKMQHPDGVREINELHLPVGKAVKITGTSEDVIHDFGIPAFRSKFDVVPGRYISTWYLPNKVGEYHIFCDQYCGQGHSQMVGKVYVMEEADYKEWLDGQVKTKGRGPADGSPAWQGRQLFLKLLCITCHNNVYDADKSNPNSSNRAPNLEGLYMSKIPLQGGGFVTADDNYIRESIRNPMAKVHDGWKPVMPAFSQGQVSEFELKNLVAYIKSLKPGDLPRRTDQFPASVGAPTQPSEGGSK
jgi:cytochrome c oxidase subunit II